MTAAMKSPLFYKALIIALAILLALVGVVSAALIFRTRNDLSHFRREDQDLRERLAAVTLKLQQSQNILDRLQNDPVFLERIARSRLGLAKPDELIFRFDVDPLTSAPPGGSDSNSSAQWTPLQTLPTIKSTTPVPAKTPAANPGATHR